VLRNEEEGEEIEIAVELEKVVKGKKVLPSVYFFLENEYLTSYACAIDREEKKIDFYKYSIEDRNVKLKETLGSID